MITADFALTNAALWFYIILLMITYDLIKFLWRKWQGLADSNLKNSRRMINAHCNVLVDELKRRDSKQGE